MKIGDLLTNNKVIQSLTGLADSTESDTDSASNTTSSEFETLLSSILHPDAANNISEEELFAGMVQERVKTQKGDEAQKKYIDLLQKQEGALKKSDGFIPFEDAAKEALRQLRDAGELTKEEADKIYSESFAAAQLDSNTGALFDNRGGGNDATIAVQTMEQALAGAQAKIKGFDDGSIKYDIRSADEASNTKTSSAPASAIAGTIGTGNVSTGLTTPNGTTVDGPDGFLFKPVSNNEGTLAVLLPSAMAHLVASLILKDSTGTVLDEGRSTGYGDTGEREKFAFSKQGGDYPKDIIVEVRMSDGSIKEYSIPDPSKRYD